ncbi:TetR/AcrR family transcriptional regulator [Shewanella maritima]|uniref:TetR/AcrR family transcriptional regulator n=1 Tax=Shewanella maritima TaxID=2520507 RepID=UPI003736D47B
MAKTAKYDRQQVIDKATNLYWQKGFHATSMRNLQDEIDMRPGSIYSAFGNKDGLFKEALRNYTDMGIAQVQLCKSQHSSPIAALKAFVQKQVIDTQEGAPNGMCMLAKTMGELTDENQELIDITKAHLGEIAAEFEALIQQAQSLGEVAKTKSAKDLANHVQIQIAGLRTFAKINNDKSQLHTMIDEIFSHYPFQ